MLDVHDTDLTGGMLANVYNYIVLYSLVIGGESSTFVIDVAQYACLGLSYVALCGFPACLVFQRRHYLNLI